MLEQLFFFFVYIFGAVIAYIYFSENYELKQKTPVSFLIAFVLYTAGFLINLFFDNSILVNDITFIVINVIYCKLSFKISIGSSIFHSSIMLAIMFSSEIIVEAGASYLLHIPIDAYKNSLTALIIIGTICKILYFTVCKIISTLFSYKKNNATNDIKKNLILFVYPLITTAMLSIFLYTSSIYKFSREINFIYVLLSIGSLLLCCLIFIINKNFQKQENELIKLQAEKQRKDMNNTFYSMLERKNDEQRILVHDIKHHFAAISTLENISDVKEYIAKVQPELTGHKFIGKTKNKMFDLILDRYSNICQSKSIDFIVDIRASNLDFIENTDLVSILSNALDNAVEAVIELNKPTIRLSTKSDKNFVILTIINDCAKKPKSDGERLITTKSNTAYHGYGIKSIEKTVCKYDGICNWYFDETENEFHFNILFNKNR